MNFNNNSAFPVQKVSFREKTKSWKENSVDGVIGRMGLGRAGSNARKETMAVNYKLYNSEFDKNDLKYIVDPYEVGDTFPASPQEMNIIRPKIDLLIGEESKRPFNFMMIQTNDEAVTDLQNKKKEMLMQYIMSDLGLTPEDMQTATPPEIEHYLKYNYKTIAEIQANQTLEHLKERLYLENEFLRGWKDALIAGEEIYYVGINNGEPVLNRINPIDCDYDGNPNLERIENGDWFVNHSFMTPEEIYDTYYDKLSESDLNALLEEVKGNGQINTGSKVNTNVTYRLSITDYGITSPFERQWNALDIYHVVWRSFQKIGFLTMENEHGDMETIQVDENYKAQPGDDLEWEWVGQIWEGYKAGEKIYFGIEPLDYIDAPLDSPERQQLPYVGIIYSNTNAGNKSLVSIMKPLQYMYIILWYRLELMIARDKGKILTMDITQIPKSMDITPEKWLHYLSSVGVNFVNPYEEGWDIPGREGGKASQFNQMSAQDLSMTNVIAGYIDLLMKIEDMLGELSGVSKQRQGSIQQRELVGNVERAVIQSSHITEPLFWKHAIVKKSAIRMLIDTAKHAWKMSGKKKLHYIYNDSSRVFMDITEDFLYADFDIFATDSTKEYLNLQKIEGLLQAAMQNGGTLFEAAEVLTGGNISVIKNKLKEIDERKQAMEQQVREHEAQMQQAMIDAENQRVAEENRIKEEDSIRKAETSIIVAQIGADSKEGDVDYFKQAIDTQKLDLEEQKLNKELSLKEKQTNEELRKNKVAEKQKQEEISIKRIQAHKPISKSN